MDQKIDEKIGENPALQAIEKSVDEKAKEVIGKIDDAEKARALDKREKEILEIEKRVDKKIEAGKKLIEQMEVEGRSRVGAQESEEEKWKRETKAKYAGTGFDPT